MAKNKMHESCERFAEAMWLFLAEELADADRTFWQEHLQSCDACSEALAEARQTLAAYRGLGEDDIDDIAFARAVQSAVTPPSLPRRLLSRKIVLGWAAPLAVAAGLLLFLLQPEPETETLHWQSPIVDGRLVLLEEDIYRVEMLELADIPLGSLAMDATLWESEMQHVAHQIEMLHLELAVSSQAEQE